MKLSHNEVIEQNDQINFIWTENVPKMVFQIEFKAGELKLRPG